MSSAPTISGVMLNLKFSDPIIPYSPARLEADLAAGVSSIVAGVGGNYMMDINTAISAIVIKNKDAVYNGTAAAPAAGLTAIALTGAGLAMGYNDPGDGSWKNAIAISATGDVTIAGTLKSGSVIEVGTTVGGTDIAAIKAGASAGLTAVQPGILGALATQNSVNLATQVAGYLATASIGSGALPAGVTINGATQVNNLGSLAFANTILASQVTTGSITSATIDTSSYVKAYGYLPTPVSLAGSNVYPTIYGSTTTSNGVAVLAWAGGSASAAVEAYAAHGNAVSAYAVSGAGDAVNAQANTGHGVHALTTSASYYGVFAENYSGAGYGLFVTGWMGINNSTLVSNLNAEKLGGNYASAFLTSSGTAYNSTYFNYKSDYQFCQYVSTDGGGVAYPASGNAGFYFYTSFAGFDYYASGTSVELRNTSDRRIKDMIEAEQLGLDFVNALLPVTYYMKRNPTRRFHGFIAQDVEPLIAQDDDALKITHADGIKGVDYMSLLAPIVRAIQQLSEKVSALEH